MKKENSITKVQEREKDKKLKIRKVNDAGGSPTLKLGVTEAGALGTFGSSDEMVFRHFLDQLSRGFKGVIGPEGHDNEAFVTACNTGMAILSGIQPKDEIEGMLAVQMIAVHNVAMETLGRAMISGQTFDGKQANVNQATKMLRTFAIQMEALKKYRTGGQQTVTVQHVNVGSGGQAIVGNLAGRGGGG